MPFLAVLATTPDVSQQLGLRHKTLGRRAHQLGSLLRRWLPGVPIKLMGDLAYSILELGHQVHPDPVRTTEFAPALPPPSPHAIPLSGYAPL